MQKNSDQPDPLKTVDCANDKTVEGSPDSTVIDSSPPAPVDSDKKATSQKQPSLGKTFSLVALLTVLSKFAGLARDIIILQYFGTTRIADAFNVATLFTGNILVLFGGLGGPFHSSAVTVLTPRKDSGDCGRLTIQLLVWTGLVMGLITALVFLAAPYIVPMVAPGSGTLADKQIFWQETVSQLRIMSPLILIAGLVGIGCGISNTYNQFFWPSMAPAVASLAIIISVTGFNKYGGICLAAGTLVGAIGQLIVQLPGMLRASPTIKGLNLFGKMEPGMQEYIQMLWPATISTSIGYLYSYVDVFFTSQIEEGGWTALVNANRLVQLPLGVLLTAMLVPILPRFTMYVTEDKISDLKAELRKALTLLWFLALPMSAILLAVPAPIVRLLFERGKFNEHSTELLTTVLLFLVPSIFFYVARDLITRVFYAHRDSKTPYHVGMFAIFVKALITWLLVSQLHLGLGGIALSTSLITVFNLTLLSILLRKKVGNLGAGKLVKPVTIMLLASALCGGISYYLYAMFYPIVLGLVAPMVLAAKIKTMLVIFASLAISCGTGLLAYLVVCYLGKLDEVKQIARRLRLAR